MRADGWLGQGRSTLASTLRDVDDRKMLTNEGLDPLTDDECVELLQRGGVGRLGITIAGLPAIMPVNYALVDGDVVFRVGEGTQLSVATQGAVIAFEVDAYDAYDAYDATSSSGWSVLVIGRSSAVTSCSRCSA